MIISVNTLISKVVTVIGQTPQQSESYVFENTLANVTHELVDQVRTFVC